MPHAHLILSASLLMATGAIANDAPSLPDPARSSGLAPAKPAIAAHAGAARAKAATLVEPQLRVARSNAAGRPRVALTFDACMGKTDDRILSVLVSERIPATIFVTARWLRSNPQAVTILRQNADLFEVENHGQNHIPAVDVPASIYGIAAAGSTDAVRQEVAGGADAMREAGIAPPHWFRGSTAKYDASAIRQIRTMGYKIAGYSLNGDGGSMLGAAVAERKIAAARDGDVVIAHINQPTHTAGEGVARALLTLKKRGVEFVKLQDVEQTGDHDTTRNIATAIGQ
ncbi:polysaccharide deacetylase family protein [Rhizobiales bacterium RZME27]|uniref:Chitooligosaccharide deacetylase n=1 Tax=Endobacterium cereale TaxID=2663029 RepID=A0A6A8AIS2_9HYPH|nr:polysaccharide deacetylase family protein [Endobacterium cereale]MEB2843135.1 polysaccharide deacetylase family protein [Endobacterium cereale]MQY49610.1 polysaccharide deacetylase family protein [Endobacterium cereale]